MLATLGTLATTAGGVKGVLDSVGIGGGGMFGGGGGSDLATSSASGQLYGGSFNPIIMGKNTFPMLIVVGILLFFLVRKK